MSQIIYRPKAILFDHDGVLVTSEQLHFLAWQQLLKDMGLPWSEIRFEGMVGRPAPVILTALLDRFKPGWSREDYDVDALALKKNDYYLGYAQTQLGLYPGVREGLIWAKAEGIPCGVVSNSKRRELKASLSLLNIESFFKVVLSRDDVVRPKPDPGPFEFAALSLGVAPEDCIAIDDSPTGLEGALLAGCTTASVTTNYPRSALEVPIPGRTDLRPVWIGDTMEAFFDWLGRLPRAV
jgi:HAD superfamily hydrolase (TIGR01509 family)